MATQTVIEATDANFDESVLKSDLPVLIDFWAAWCGPCKMIAPLIDELATDYTGKATVGKVNIDDEMELAQQFGVSSIPTLIVLKNGKEVNRFVGVTAKGQLAKAIDQA